MVFIFFGNVMKLNKNELKKLQDLSCIMLNPKEEEQFLDKLENIITMLEQCQSVEIDESVEDTGFYDTSLPLQKWVDQSDDAKDMLQNVEHEVINNSVVVKSVLR